MVLSPNLYRMLKMEFGEVKIINEGLPRLETREGNRYVVAQRGEHYNICCPFCGDDRFRLSISYCFLSTVLNGHYRNKTLAQCYNESCEDVTSDAFVDPLIEKLELIEMGVVDPTEVTIPVPAEVSGVSAMRMPTGLVSLTELPPTHPALVFLASKYPRLPLSNFVRVGAMFAAERDSLCPAAYNRIIFPIEYEGQKVAWQGRSIDPTNSLRWFLPPGFQKTLYNLDNVSDIETPVVCEGITSSLACGSTGVCLFGKTVTHKLLSQLKRWSSLIIATDPDTFVPDFRGKLQGKVAVNELKDYLSPHFNLRFIQWPEVVLEMARRSNKGDDIKVPDAADLGSKIMQQLIMEAR